MQRMTDREPRKLAFMMLTVWVLASVVGGPVASQEVEDEEPFASGLMATYTDSTGNAIQRLDRAIQFAWDLGTPDPRLATGPFRARWQGYLMSQANGTYQLHAYSTGRVAITLRGTKVIEAVSDKPSWHSSEPIDLAFDYHPLQVEFEASTGPATVSLFWSGPQFQLEPIDGRQFFHDRTTLVDMSFEQGGRLVRALRCAACHEIPGQSETLAAPALDRLAGNLNTSWIVEWLTERPNTSADGTDAASTERHMPYFSISESQAQAIASYLLAASKATPKLRATKTSEKKAETKQAKSQDKKKKSEDVKEDRRTPAEAGQELAMTLGCLACHRVNGMGTSNLFGGGDLSHIAVKRPASYFEQWLAEPAALNKNHRMPMFELTGDERQHLAAFLATLGASSPRAAEAPKLSQDPATVSEGRKLFTEFQCGRCHEGPESPSENETLPRRKLMTQSNWSRSCSGVIQADTRPGYYLSEQGRGAVETYLRNIHPNSKADHTGSRLVEERNCLACHARGSELGLAPALTAVAERHQDLAPLVPAMTPPPLISVGDKLHDEALRDAIRRVGSPHRPYLRVRMPRFALPEAELDALVKQMITEDRIPSGAPVGIQLRTNGNNASADPLQETNVRTDEIHAGSRSKLLLDAIGSRLVTPDGFGCTSCHQIGSVEPVKAPLNARGSNLSLLGKRIRRSWFDRWVRNPARIIPRMEMPSVQIPVRGILEEDLDAQLAAVWDVLNQPGFEPPLPNPVRIVRHSGAKPDHRALVITDVIRTKSTTFIKPLLIGLSNRHNVLFDLETARLASWSIGDVARQRTEGKTWFWEAAGKDLISASGNAADLSVLVDQKTFLPQPRGQFVTEFDELQHRGNQFRFTYRLHFGAETISATGTVKLIETFQPLPAAAAQREGGFRRRIEMIGLPESAEIRLHVVSSEQYRELSTSDDGKQLNLATASGTGVRLRGSPNARLLNDGHLAATTTAEGSLDVELEYFTDLPVDQFPTEASAPLPVTSAALDVVPGFSALRLPLSEEVMPTALAWGPAGDLFIASLKGQVWLAADKDHDGMADSLQVFSDDLAAPYGLHVGDGYVDVVNKYALLRLFDDDQDGQADRTATVASGWGHTADYHDWAVGLQDDGAGNYYIALPCQQDNRSAAAAHLRGEFLRLVPREVEDGDPRLFNIERVSAGHRFPMGIARNREGELFVTDNQGNYNPFNELNHIRPGAHFGFINAIDKNEPPPAEVTSPSINIPHPWTRSVNGICFLETPQATREKTGGSTFGPWEGHLIGCEYDTRRLIRMTLQKVGDRWQGAAYPFSYDQPPSGPPLLGPITAAVSPDGDLYVGGLRDSGWGGANNIGEVVRLRFDPKTAGNGIREMRATANGFEIEFLKAVGAEAENPESYQLASYTRESTPAYGGPDVHRRTEKIDRIRRSSAGKKVTLELNELRAGYVYELHVKGLTTEAFFPAEAHYTLGVIPPN